MYTINNPLRYIDPSGHDPNSCWGGSDCYGGSNPTGKNIDPAPGIDPAEHERLVKLRLKALELSRLMHAGEISDIEALKALWEYALDLYDRTPKGVRIYDKNSLIRDLGIVVGGLEVLDFSLNAVGNGPAGTFRIIAPDNPLSRYYVGYDAFDPADGTTGFNDALNPEDDNQVRHFLAGLFGGEAFGGVGRDFMISNEDDTADRMLFVLAFELLDYLDKGNALSTVPDWINNHLGK